MHVEFLPLYSPDYNPIELTFLAMKYHLHRNGEYACLAMTELSDKEIFFTLTTALYKISAAGVFGWFRHCGYV
jgi:transposase